jgi:predicted DNA-binding WGR domain protein
MPKRFELQEGTAAKFWEVGIGGPILTVRFGRLGTDGQTKTKRLASPSAAAAAADALIREKTRKGYAEVGAKRRAKAKPVATAPSVKRPSASGSIIARLDRALEASYPKLRKRMAAPKSLAPLAKAIGGPVPDALAALWSWHDGAPDFLVAERDSSDRIDWLSVRDSVSAFAQLSKLAGFDARLIPFATDGAGNYLCFNAKTQRILEWDHETREASPRWKTLDELLALTLRSVTLGNLAGGPEQKKGQTNPRVERARKLLSKPLANSGRFLDAVVGMKPVLAVGLLRELRDAILALDEEPSSKRGALGHVSHWLAMNEAELGQFAESITSLEQMDKNGRKDSGWRFAVARHAINAGAYQAAFDMLAKPTARDLDGLAGQVVALSRLGKTAGPVIKATTKLIDSEAKRMGTKDNVDAIRYRAKLEVRRATMKAAAGDKVGAKKILAMAVSRYGKQYVALDHLAKAVLA